MAETFLKGKGFLLLILLIGSIRCSTVAENADASGKILDSLKNIEKMEKQILEKQSEVGKPKENAVKKKGNVARRLKAKMKKKEELEQELTLLQTQYMGLKQDRKRQRKLRGRSNHRHYRYNKNAIKIARMQQRIADLKEQLSYNDRAKRFPDRRRKLFWSSSKSHSEHESVEEEGLSDMQKNMIYGGAGLATLGLGTGAAIHNNNEYRSKMAHVNRLLVMDNMVDNLYSRDVSKLKNICTSIQNSHSRLETTKNNVMYRLNSRINQLFY